MRWQLSSSNYSFKATTSRHEDITLVRRSIINTEWQQASGVKILCEPSAVCRARAMMGFASMKHQSPDSSIGTKA